MSFFRQATQGYFAKIGQAFGAAFFSKGPIQ
jgi:hypothetical protein